MGFHIYERVQNREDYVVYIDQKLLYDENTDTRFSAVHDGDGNKR